MCLQHSEQKFKRSTPSQQLLSSQPHQRPSVSCTSVAASARGEAVRAAQPRFGPVVSNRNLLPSPRKQLTDRQRDGWMTQNYSSASILRINIAFKNTPSGQEQRNQQVQQGAAGRRHVGLLDLEPVLRKISSALCSWMSICGFSVGHRVEGSPFDVFIHMYCVSCW